MFTAILFLHFLSSATAAIDIFNRLVNEPQARWAFLFDELELAPGWSRQVFKYDGNFGSLNREFSQGFALKFGPVVDVYITRRVFVGAKLDLIFNFHRQVCSQSDGGGRVCGDKSDKNQASVHQMIAGFHVGATF